jgi:hypothetical protein
MAGKITSISGKQLSTEIANAVKTAVARHASFKGATVESGVAMFPPGVIGLILRNFEPEKSSLGQLQSLATDVAKALPSAKGGQPAALVHGGHIIIGFIQEPAITLLKE